MARLTETLAPVAIATVGVLVVGLGFLAIGGPESARQERRDQQRQTDLQRLDYQVQCLAGNAGNLLPQAIAGTDACPLPDDLVDPKTGEAYRYQILSEQSYRICATFESDAPVYDQRFDPESGCLSATVSP